MTAYLLYGEESVDEVDDTNLHGAKRVIATVVLADLSTPWNISKIKLSIEKG